MAVSFFSTVALTRYGIHLISSGRRPKPDALREFYFVLDGGDYHKAFDALQVMLWPYSFSQRQIDQAQSAHGKLSKGHGKNRKKIANLNDFGGMNQ